MVIEDAIKQHGAHKIGIGIFPYTLNISDGKTFLKDNKEYVVYNFCKECNQLIGMIRVTEDIYNAIRDTLIVLNQNAN